MTGRQIETSREIRLWITQIGAPVALGLTLLYKNNEQFRSKVHNLFKKKEKEDQKYE